MPLFMNETFLPLTEIAARLALATILGAIIGFEREWRQRPAGLRTHVLVSIAAATAAILTLELVHLPAFEDDAVRLDPGRLVEAVTGGVAFLAAGFIVFAKGQIHGLTTGAGVWLVGVVGLACGLGLWQVATAATLLGLIVLAFLWVMEDRFIEGNSNKTLASEETGKE